MRCYINTDHVLEIRITLHPPHYYFQCAWVLCSTLKVTQPSLALSQYFSAMKCLVNHVSMSLPMLQAQKLREYLRTHKVVWSACLKTVELKNSLLIWGLEVLKCQLCHSTHRQWESVLDWQCLQEVMSISCAWNQASGKQATCSRGYTDGCMSRGIREYWHTVSCYMFGLKV